MRRAVRAACALRLSIFRFLGSVGVCVFFVSVAVVVVVVVVVVVMIRLGNRRSANL